MVGILLIIDSLVNYSKSDIDLGITPPKIYKICSCIKEQFCLSYNIRKENDLYLYFLAENLSVKFIGEELRYLGPDERSQALLLNKAIKKAEESPNINNKHWIDSTPGIYARRYRDFSLFVEELSNLLKGRFKIILNKIEIIRKEFDLKLYELNKETLEKDSFVILFLDESISIVDVMHIFKNMDDPIILHIPKVNNSDDKILYTNYLLDNL
ncbi:MAG: hypothetical protein P8Y70_11165 [Candidatus Lokiarchaeota archaeon]